MTRLRAILAAAVLSCAALAPTHADDLQGVIQQAQDIGDGKGLASSNVPVAQAARVQRKHKRCAAEDGDPGRAVAAARTSKKGVALQANYFRPPYTLTPGDVGGCFGASWYYTWGPDSLPDLDDIGKQDPRAAIAFVPMIHGAGRDLKPPYLLEVDKDLGLIHDRMKATGEECPTVLLFNEPDNQKKVTVEGVPQVKVGPPMITADYAAAQFQGIKKSLPCSRFGEPVTAYGGDWHGHGDQTKGCRDSLSRALRMKPEDVPDADIAACVKNINATYDWMGDFEKDLKSGGEMGFVTMHRYMGCAVAGPNKGPSADNFKRDVYALWKYHRGKKKIWISELGLGDWSSGEGGPNQGKNACATTPDENIAFVREIVPWLEGCPYVERYAWFTPSPEDDFFGDQHKDKAGNPIVSNSFPTMPGLLFDADGLLTPLGRAYAESGSGGRSDCDDPKWDRR